MKRKLKAVAMLICLFILLPIFSGCNLFGEKEKITEFSHYGYGGNLILYGSTNDIYDVFPDNLGYTSNITVKDSSKIKSYRVVFKKNERDEFLYDKKESSCKNLNTEDGLVIEFPDDFIESNHSHYLDYTFYDETDCLGNSVETLKTPKLHTFEPPTDTNALASLVGFKDSYCNIDANGSLKDLGETHDLAARVAYSQIGYYFQSENQRIGNGCYGYTGANGFQYSRYGTADTIEIAQLNFVRWVLEKVYNYFPDVNSINELITWAKDNKIYYTDKSKIREGDLVVSYSGVGVIYDSGFSWGNISFGSSGINMSGDSIYGVFDSFDVDINAIGYIDIKNLTEEYDIVEKIGGKEHYCYRSPKVYYDLSNSNLFARIANSQHYYYGKAENNDLNLCLEEKGKTGLYTKYSPSNDINVINLDFVKWVANKSKISFPNVNTLNELITWAKRNNRYSENKQLPKQGDLVIYNSYDNQKRIGIFTRLSSNDSSRTLHITTFDKFFFGATGKISYFMVYWQYLDSLEDEFTSISMEGIAY